MNLAIIIRIGSFSLFNSGPFLALLPWDLTNLHYFRQLADIRCISALLYAMAGNTIKSVKQNHYINLKKNVLYQRIGTVSIDYI